MADVTELIRGLQARPKCYITLEVAFDEGDATKPGVILGAVQSITIKSERKTNSWRELDYNTSGKIRETFPGLPGYDISLNRVVLYESTLSAALQFTDGIDLIKQNRPLRLVVAMQNPDGATQTWYIHGVWFKSSGPMAFDVSEVDDVRIIQKVDATATSITGA